MTLVIIVTHNSQGTIQECLTALEAARVKQPFDLVLIDNDSQDETLALARRFSWVKIKPQSQNLGFAKANNLALKWGLENNYNFFALINPDAFVSKNFLRPLLAVFQKFPTAGIAQPMILQKKNPSLINTAGNSLHFLGLSTLNHYNQEFQPKNWQIQEIPVASGAAMIIKKEVFAKIGLFNDDFFLYFEDTEFCWRARLAGFSVWLEPKSLVYHDYIFKQNPARFYHLEKNRLYSWFSLWSFKAKFFLFPAWLVFELALITSAFLNDWGKEKIKAYTALFKRKKGDFERKGNERLMLKFISGEINYPFNPPPLGLKLINPFLRGYWRLAQKFLWRE